MIISFPAIGFPTCYLVWNCLSEGCKQFYTLQTRMILYSFVSYGIRTKNQDPVYSPGPDR
jgi:hypothetical protein